MNMKTMKNCFAAVIMALLVVHAGGCAKKDQMTLAESAVASPPGEAGDEPLATPADQQLFGNQGARTSSPLQAVFFDFNRYHIRDDQSSRVVWNADYLKQNPQARLRIEGNCDDRGTTEYNMALGDRRAQSAKKYLVSLGVPAAQLDAISLGEENPLVVGQDEQAWATNRRADFVILQ